MNSAQVSPSRRSPGWLGSPFVIAFACWLVTTACAGAEAARDRASPAGVRAGSASLLGVIDSYPVVVVPADKLPATRDFYVSRLGLTLVFDSTWFVALGHGSDGSIALALMAHDHPSSPPGPETLDGRGAFVTLQVSDARAAFRHLERAGIAPVHPLTDEPWGQRRFSLRDPAGTLVDVVEQLEPAPGFWEPYMPEHSRPR